MGKVCPFYSLQHSYFTRAHRNLLAPRAHTRTYARTAPIPPALLGRHRDTCHPNSLAHILFSARFNYERLPYSECDLMLHAASRANLSPCFAWAALPTSPLAHPTVPASCLEGEASPTPSAGSCWLLTYACILQIPGRHRYRDSHWLLRYEAIFSQLPPFLA